jgi:transmembrane sensor
VSKYPLSDNLYSIEKFLDDPHFQDWVLRSDSNHEAFWREWISKNPEAAPYIKEARRILIEINKPAYRLDEADVMDIWKNIQQDIQPKRVSVVKNSYFRRFGLGWAAACLVLASSLAFYFFMVESSPQRVYHTGYGETLEILLPDGSTVMLNSNSTLSFKEDWDSNSVREVWIEGEAFFDVQHLENHQPFKVFPASGIEVEVLGTQFNVYQRNEQTKVLLSEGNVTMSFADMPQKAKILMKPGDLVEYNQQKIQKKQVNPASYVSWTKKVLLLDSMTLDEMVRMAEDNFGLQIKVGPNVNLSQSASGSMPLSDGSSFMRLTARIFNVQIEYRDSIYYLE